LTELVQRHCNVLVTGAASTGKTTLLNALCAHISAHERVITVEDTAELQLQASHVVRLEARPTTTSGVEGISISELLRTALRMRPDRFVVGEVRGAEVVDMLAAMNTGHNGSFATCHANSADDALLRLESLMLQHCGQWPRAAIAQHICAAIDVVVFVGRNADGTRSVVQISEVATTPETPCRPLLRQDTCGGVRSELRIGQLTRTRS
jgi:pilus assembly protein CpaF